jgi:hypothetical protein
MYCEDEWYDDNVCSDCRSHYDDWGYCPFCDGLWATYEQDELDDDEIEQLEDGLLDDGVYEGDVVIHQPYDQEETE